jgi:hypothetical protein
MPDSQEARHLRELMDERDRRYQERFEASQKALDAALMAADRAVQAALSAAKEAVIKAELSADKRFELLNELRTGVATTDQLEALEKIVTELKETQNRGSGRSAGIAALYGWIVGAVALVGGVIAIVVSLH